MFKEFKNFLNFLKIFILLYFAFGQWGGNSELWELGTYRFKKFEKFLRVKGTYFHDF